MKKWIHQCEVFKGRLTETKSLAYEAGFLHYKRCEPKSTIIGFIPTLIESKKGFRKLQTTIQINRKHEKESSQNGVQ